METNVVNTSVVFGNYAISNCTVRSLGILQRLQPPATIFVPAQQLSTRTHAATLKTIIPSEQPNEFPSHQHHYHFICYQSTSQFPFNFDSLVFHRFKKSILPPIFSLTPSIHPTSINITLSTPTMRSWRCPLPAHASFQSVQLLVCAMVFVAVFEEALGHPQLEVMR